MLEVAVGLASALFGGLGVKLIEAMITRKGQKHEALVQHWRGTQTDLAAARQEARECRQEAAEWREKYWRLLEQKIGGK